MSDKNKLNRKIEISETREDDLKCRKYNLFSFWSQSFLKKDNGYFPVTTLIIHEVENFHGPFSTTTQYILNWTMNS